MFQGKPIRLEPAMYTLYWSPGTGSFAPHAALNEVGAQFDLVEIDLESNQHHSPEFLAINPRAQVPVLTLPDGTVMTESVAMMMHIADCHPESALMPEIGAARRATAYRWLVFCAVNLYETGCRIEDTHHYSDNPTDYDGIRDKALINLNEYWTMVSDAIGEGPFLFGRACSAVDICLLMIAQWHPDSDELLQRLPKLTTLCDAVRARPAIDEVWHLHFAD
jgi:glutathione S-transferase/GST-like protein